MISRSCSRLHAASFDMRLISSIFFSWDALYVQMEKLGVFLYGCPKVNKFDLGPYCFNKKHADKNSTFAGESFNKKHPS